MVVPAGRTAAHLFATVLLVMLNCPDVPTKTSDGAVYVAANGPDPLMGLIVPGPSGLEPSPSRSPQLSYPLLPSWSVVTQNPPLLPEAVPAHVTVYAVPPGTPVNVAVNCAECGLLFESDVA